MPRRASEPTDGTAAKATRGGTIRESRRLEESGPVGPAIGDTSLEFLDDLDRLFQNTFRRIRDDEQAIPVVDEQTRQRAVERRYRYGEAVKAALSWLAVRQSAAVHVAHTIERTPEMAATANEILDRATRCRSLINNCRDTVRDRPLMSINTDGRFAARFSALMELADDTINWELQVAIPAIKPIPAIKQALPDTIDRARFHNRRHVRRPAPTRLAARPRWHERARVLSRKTMFDHLMEARF